MCAELQEKNDHVRCPYLPACSNLVTLGEASKGSSLTKWDCNTVITQGIEHLKAENMVDLALKGDEHLSPSCLEHSGTANSCDNVHATTGLTQI